MTRKGKWVKIGEMPTKDLDKLRGNFNDEFLSNPMSVVQLLTKVLRYQGLIYNRVVDIREQIAELQEDIRILKQKGREK